MRADVSVGPALEPGVFLRILQCIVSVQHRLPSIVFQERNRSLPGIFQVYIVHVIQGSAQEHGLVIELVKVVEDYGKTVRPGPVRTTLIRPRISFVDNMLKSVENL